MPPGTAVRGCPMAKALFDPRSWVVIALLLCLVYAATTINYDYVLETAGFVEPGIYVPLNDHAYEKHPGEAESVQYCLENYGQIGPTLTNQLTGRKAMICYIPWLMKYGVKIVEANCDMASPDGCVTAFIKHKMKTLLQVVKYLKNAGYEVIP